MSGAAAYLRQCSCGRTFLKEVGGFDEGLGVGAETPFQSGEDTELLLRAIKKGFQIQYLPSLVVYHPLPPPYSHAAVTRAGMGRVLRKHGERPLWSSWRCFGGALARGFRSGPDTCRARVRTPARLADAPRSQERLAVSD